MSPKLSRPFRQLKLPEGYQRGSFPILATNQPGVAEWRPLWKAANKPKRVLKEDPTFGTAVP